MRRKRSGRIHCIAATPWMGQQPDDNVVAQVSDSGMRKYPGIVEAERPTGSGGISTDWTREPLMASPRLIPAPDSPLYSAETPPEPALGDTGETSASFDCNCAPPQAPVCGNANCDQPSYGQLHRLCERRGYHWKDAEAVLRTRLAAMDAADNKTKEGGSNDMDTSMYVFGKRTRTMEDFMGTGATADGDSEQRPRGGALEIFFSS